MNSKPLTERQEKVLDIILKQVNTFGEPPTIREIRDVAGIKSTRGVLLQLEALENAGYLTRTKGARGIKVNSALLQSNNKKTIRLPLAEEDEKVSIKLMSSPIPAGYASMVEEFSDDELEVSIKDTKGLNNVFAVRVKGDSMINAGIDDGDTAIIKSTPIADDGDIVAALIPENGVTLKKYKVVEGRPVLVPANPKYSLITDNFIIQGKLINILKGK